MATSTSQKLNIVPILDKDVDLESSEFSQSFEECCFDIIITVSIQISIFLTSEYSNFRVKSLVKMTM